MSFYKLNFDGRVVGNNPGSSGIGGLIKDSEAACILLFSGPLGVCSVNEAGLVALRTGLRECVNLGLSNIIVEGDSWCASRWVAGSSIPLWRFVYAAKEVLEIALMLNACFVHVLQSANEVADLLA